MLKNNDVSSLHGKQVAILYGDHYEPYGVAIGEVLNISNEVIIYIKEMGNYKVTVVFAGSVKSINLLGEQLYSES